MEGIYRCISGHETEEDRRPRDVYRYGVCPICKPRTMTRFVREGFMLTGTHDLIRDQFDKQTRRLASARREAAAKAVETAEMVTALRDAHTRTRERQLRLNADLRTANIALRASIGLRNGDIHDLKREVIDQRVRYADTHEDNASLRAKLAAKRLSLGARKAQNHRLIARLASTGIMLDDLRKQMSKEQIKSYCLAGDLRDDAIELRTELGQERAQVALNRVATEKRHGEDLYRAGIRYNALKFDLREIGRLSSNASSGDVWADLMKINAIAQKG